MSPEQDVPGDGTLDYESEWYRKGWTAGHAAALSEQEAEQERPLDAAIERVLDWAERAAAPGSVLAEDVAAVRAALAKPLIHDEPVSRARKP